MIRSSVNRDFFIVRLPPGAGLYPSLEEITGCSRFGDLSNIASLLGRVDLRLPPSGGNFRPLI
jgi:hypothetical protein